MCVPVVCEERGGVIDHGTLRAYDKDHCRCHLCAGGNAIRMNRYRQRRVRNGGMITKQGVVGGHTTVSSKTPKHQVIMLRRRLTYEQMAEFTGFNPKTFYVIARGKRIRVNAPTAAAIQALWEDYCAPVEVDTRRYPVAPLRSFLERRYGTLLAAGKNIARDVHRLEETGLTATQADKWALRYSRMPTDWWPEFGLSLEEAS